MSTIGSKIFDYEVTRRIKAGGMGVVYEARRTWGKGEKVAIKFLLDQLRDDPRIRQRFIREAEILEQLSHPFIVRILGLDPERDAFVMEFVEGVTLSEQLRREPTTYREPAVAFAFMVKLLEAFDYAHNVPVEIKGRTENGIIHRDIKPSNIIVQPNGDPKVLDFGISRILTLESTLTDPKLQMGSVAYMSPEQVVNPTDVDWRSDIYSLGVNLWELFAGKSPYPHITTYEVVVQVQNRIRHEPLPLLANTLPDLTNSESTFLTRIDQIICKATEKDRDRRYQNCQEMLAAIKMFITNAPVSTEIMEVPTAIASERVGRAQEHLVVHPADNFKPAPVSPPIIHFRDERAGKHSEPEPVTPSRVSRSFRPGNKVLYGGLAVLCIAVIFFVWNPFKREVQAGSTEGKMEAANTFQDYANLDEFAKAAKADSLHDVANHYFNGSNGKRRDLAEAAKFYRMAADLGSPSAQTRLASLYETGTGIVKDKAEAVKLYREAAGQGNTEAREHLAKLGESW